MTKIFETYSDFLDREDKDVNGVSPAFAEDYPGYEKDNESNKGCWNCSDCSDCSGCSGCSHINLLFDKKDINPAGEAPAAIMGNYPVIANIHQKVYEAASAKPDALNMSDWHTCDTTHCRAGWVVFLAGEAGRRLEQHTSTLFAAMQIYDASSRIPVSPVRFFEDNKTALNDMKRCTELEAATS